MQAQITANYDDKMAAMDSSLYQAQIDKLFNQLETAFQGLKNQKKDQDSLCINRVFSNEIEVQFYETSMPEMEF